jgi:hypothetical protein
MQSENGKPLYPLKDGTPPLSLIKVSAILSIDKVVIPGFSIFATSVSVADTIIALFRMISISAFVLICIIPNKIKNYIMHRNYVVTESLSDTVTVSSPNRAKVAIFILIQSLKNTGIGVTQFLL